MRSPWGADVLVTAGHIALTGDNTFIRASPATNSTGPGGDVTLAAADALTLTGGAAVAVTTLGAGRGGDLAVRAHDVLIRGVGANDTATGLFAGSESGAPGDGGAVTVRADAVRLRSGGNIAGSTTGPGRGSDLTIVAASRLTITGAGTGVQSRSAAPANGGPGGQVHITAGEVTIAEDAFVTVATAGAGRAGNIALDVDSLTLSGGAFVFADSAGAGRAGDITVRARGAVTLAGRPDDATALQAITSAPSGGGNGGDVTVSAESVTLTNGAQIASGTLGSGNGGRVAVTARRDISLASEAFIGNVATATATGDGGGIDLRAARLSLSGGALVVANVLGTGDGGSIHVRAGRLDVSRGRADPLTGLFAETGEGTPGAAGDVTIDHSGDVSLRGGIISVATKGAGPAGDLTVAARSLSVDGPNSLVLAISYVSGPAGRLRLALDRLTITGGGAVAAGTFGAGAGGVAAIDVRDLRMRGLPSDDPDNSTTAIFIGTSGAGAGGNLTLRADSIRIDHGAAISVGTDGPGDGGAAHVTARTVRLDRGGIVASSGPPGGTGDAGSFSVTASDVISLRNHADIGATSDVANGGNIDLRAARRISVRDSEVTAHAGEVGGDIDVATPGVLYLFNGKISADGDTRIGNLTIGNPAFTVLDHGSRLITTTDGTGGNITLRTLRLLRSPDARIESAAGPPELLIAIPQTNLTGSLIPVNAPLFDNAAVFAQECARRLEIDRSSFLITGRGGPQAAPPGLAPAFNLTPDPSR